MRVAGVALMLVGLTVAAGAAQTLSAPESVGMSSERLTRVVHTMRRYVDQGKIPGFITLIARRGQLVQFEAHGSRNIARGEAMTTDTILRLYSMTKPITGVAVMMLYEDGRFLLTDPVADHLPELADMQVYVGRENGQIRTEPAGTITIQHLLTHTSGISYAWERSSVGPFYIEAGVGDFTDMNARATLEEWTRDLAKLPLESQPGTAWHYGASMDVLGRLVEVVSGQSFGTFLRERLFEPLGMRDTGFYVPDGKQARLAANHGPTPDGTLTVIDDPEESIFRTPPQVELGGSGLVGTAADYLRFAQMLANGGALDDVRILSPRTVDLMMSDHMNPEMRPDPTTSLFGGLGAHRGDASREWGFGFGLTGYVVTDPALTGIPMSTGTFGWDGAATTSFWVDRDEELVGIFMTQVFGGGTLYRKVMQQMTYQAIID